MNTDTHTHTPEEWLACDAFNDIEIIDRDGWTDSEWEMQTPLTFTEFITRLGQCTISFKRLDDGK